MRHRAFSWLWKLLLAWLLIWGVVPAVLVPWALHRSLAQGGWLPAGTQLRAGTIHFNPYTLRLDMQALSLDLGDGRHVADIDEVDARLSWRSLWYRLPIIAHLRLIRPQLQLRRLASGKLDIAELVDPWLAPSSGPLPRFAIANIEVSDGRIDLDDQMLRQQHHLDQLQLAIPLLATVSAHGEPEVSPRLDLRMDGAPLHVEARAQPFGEHLHTQARLRLSHLDLPPWLPYLPARLPLILSSGSVSGDLQLDYDAGTEPSRLRLQGQLQLQGLRLQTSTGQPVLTMAEAGIQLLDVDPLQSRYHLGHIQLSQPVVQLQLDASGMPPWLASSASPHRSSVGSPVGAVPSTASTVSGPPLDLDIGSVQLDQGRADIRHDGIKDPVAIRALQLDLGHVSSNPTAAAPLQASLQLASGGTLGLDGQLQWPLPALRGRLTIKDLPLAPWMAWLPPTWRRQLEADGRIDSVLAFDAVQHNGWQLQLGKSSLSLRDVHLQHPGSAPVQWRRLDLQLDQLDPARRIVRLQLLHWQGLQLTARRQQDSLDLLQNWPSLASSHSAQVASPWRWQLDQLLLEQSHLQLQQANSEPLQLEVKQLRLQHLSHEAGRESQLDLDAVTGHRGTIQASGPIRLAPLSAQLMLKLQRIDLVPLQSLIPIPLQIHIQSARLGGKGRLQYQQDRQLAFQGDAQLTHVQIQDLDSNSELLRWRRLQLDGIELRRHRHQTRLDIGQIGLADFYARLIVYPDGHTNLRQLLAAPNEVTSTTTTATVPAATTASAGGTPSLPALQVSADLPMQLHIGGIRLLQGHLNYSDNFVKPNFNADITGLRGQIGSFGNEGGAPADMALYGTLNHLSPVLIEGHIDPLAPSAYADVTGNANSVPLPNLSAYSSRYTGYPITSGLLNADVHYILKDGQLKAENHLLISQLTFGPAVTTPGVAHLPVKLAIALLKNSRGEVDIRLPVSGSLSDPQFSIGDLFWHALRDLVGRAISSPFRLLASAFGEHSGPKELGQLQFAAGSAQLDPTAVAHLQKLAAMLQQRPSLNLDITGRADPVADLEGLREHWVDNEIHAEYHRQHIDASGPMPELAPDAYHRLLVKVYHHDRFEKPRNFLGMEKTPSDAAMTAAIKAHAEITPTQLENLASQRALAVAGWLHGKINDTRVSLHVPRIAPASDSAAAGHDQGSQTDNRPATRVDLGLH
ncbi:DUF748 domain-containing protein [Frateuria aurantia]